MTSHGNILSVGLLAILACTSPARKAVAPSPADPDLVAFIAKIKAVDNHSHANSVAPADSDADALPVDGIAPFELPTMLQTGNPDWLAAFQALYTYPFPDLSDAHLKTLRATMQKVMKSEGDSFPEWVLDQVGTEVLLANRIAMGPGLTSARFRWVSYADAMLFPLSNKG